MRSYLPEPGVVAQDIQAQLKEIGINAEIEVMESGAFLDAADRGELTGFHMLGWGADYPDQTNFLDFHFGAGASDQFGGGHPDIHQVLAEAASLTDQAERNQLYAQANPAVVYIVVSNTASGSGFVYDEQGHIVTNYHVIEGASELLVNLADGKEYEAQLVGSDPVNDLAVTGAEPRYLSAGFIIEEGLPLSDLERIVASMAETARAAGVQIVTGDTKVVNHGAVDKLFINTAGVGFVPEGLTLAPSRLQPGDRLLVSGTIGDHGMAVMMQREGLEFSSLLASDCAPLNGLI